VHVQEHTITLAGAPVFYRSAGTSGPESAAGPPVLYLHGAPTSSDDWTGLLELTGGVAPDLLGFGRSGKGGHLEYTPEALADFVADLLTDLGLARVRLAAHGWGVPVGVLLAAREPTLVQRLVLFNAVPLLDGLRWPWWARTLRVWAIGELQMGFTTKRLLTRWLREGSGSPYTWSPARLASVWEQFDQGTQRAILRLQRSVNDERMQVMAESLGALTMPTLLAWGERDPWWGAEVLEAYSSRLPNARVERIAGAGHWPWLDDPGVVELVAGFLGHDSPAAH
jgi:pimeloyl-ACP methyl ester carboxylesterase